MRRRPALSGSLRRALAAYRGMGADPPFGDPAAAHGVGMEGYYWRLTDAAAGRVVVALCGASVTRARRWAVVALASHPGGALRDAVVEGHDLDPRGFGARAGGILRGSAHRIEVRLGERDWLDAELHGGTAGPRGAFGALGPAHAIPGLPQYWHPVRLDAEVRGSACLGGRPVSLDGARAYVEKNWGRGFAREWWWGHADAFADRGATVAFAGGPLGPGRLARPLSAVVVRVGERVAALAPPLALVGSRVDGRRWAIRARRPGLAVEIEGWADGATPHVLPVPDVGAGVVEPRSRQHLAARMALRVHARGRLVYAGEAPLAGLELGRPAALRAPAPGGPRP